MGQQSKRELLAALRPRYRRGTRTEKGALLDELVATHWNGAARSIWMRGHESCPCISAPGADCLLRPARQKEGRRHGLSTTKPGTLLKQSIPVRTFAEWEEAKPGFTEVDLVAHGGDSARGEYLHSLDMVDVATRWTECIALLGHSYRVMQDAFTRLMARLPFTVLEIHPDNGGEFFNDHLYRFWQQIDPAVLHSRSRPYHKNDNRFVEQKNSSLVRAHFGDHRFESLAQLKIINQLYKQMWLYYNFFQPVMRLTEKQVIPSADGASRLQRRYDAAQPPLDRLLASHAVPGRRQEQLLCLRDQINPRLLRQMIYDLLDHLFTLPGVEPGQLEDVFCTLLNPKHLPKGEALPVTLSSDRTITFRQHYHLA